jgi:hypothetical protein
VRGDERREERACQDERHGMGYDEWMENITLGIEKSSRGNREGLRSANKAEDVLVRHTRRGGMEKMESEWVSESKLTLSDFPQTVQSYIHRIGRTGRAGRPGKAITFFSNEDAPYLKTYVHLVFHFQLPPATHTCHRVIQE